MPPIIDDETCVSCGVCFDVCSEDVFGEMEQYPVRPKYPDECWHCGACVIDCPTQAIKLYVPLPMRV